MWICCSGWSCGPPAPPPVPPIPPQPPKVSPPPVPPPTRSDLDAFLVDQARDLGLDVLPGRLKVDQTYLESKTAAAAASVRLSARRLDLAATLAVLSATAEKLTQAKSAGSFQALRAALNIARADLGVALGSLRLSLARLFFFEIFLPFYNKLLDHASDISGLVDIVSDAGKVANLSGQGGRQDELDFAVGDLLLDSLIYAGGGSIVGPLRLATKRSGRGSMSWTRTFAQMRICEKPRISPSPESCAMPISAVCASLPTPLVGAVARSMLRTIRGVSPRQEVGIELASSTKKARNSGASTPSTCCERRVEASFPVPAKSLAQ